MKIYLSTENQIVEEYILLRGTTEEGVLQNRTTPNVRKINIYNIMKKKLIIIENGFKPFFDSSIDKSTSPHSL